MSFEKLEELRCSEGLSIKRFCDLSGYSRATYYRHRAKCKRGTDAKRGFKRCNLTLRDKALDLAKRYPVYGYRKVWALLGQDRYLVSKSTVYRWLKAAGLLLSPRYHYEARRRAKEARARYLKVPQEPNELWQVDVTWVDLGDSGMHYVTNVIDYASRFPLASRVTPTHTTEDVIKAIEEAMSEAKRLRGALPKEVILVSDNGPQFTSRRFKKWLEEPGNPFRHVRGRSHHPQTTGMVERYHQSLKYEEIWRHDYSDVLEAKQAIENYRLHYAFDRPHQALNYNVPAERYIREKNGDPLRNVA